MIAQTPIAKIQLSPLVACTPTEGTNSDQNSDSHLPTTMVTSGLMLSKMEYSVETSNRLDLCYFRRDSNSRPISLIAGQDIPAGAFCNLTYNPQLGLDLIKKDHDASKNQQVIKVIHLFFFLLFNFERNCNAVVSEIMVHVSRQRLVLPNAPLKAST